MHLRNLLSLVNYDGPKISESVLCSCALMMSNAIVYMVNMIASMSIISSYSLIKKKRTPLANKAIVQMIWNHLYFNFSLLTF